MKTLCQWILSSLIALHLSIPLILASAPAYAAKNMPDWMSDGGDVDEVIGEKSQKLQELGVYIIYAGIGLWFLFGLGQLGMNRVEEGLKKMGLALVSGSMLTGFAMFFSVFS